MKGKLIVIEGNDASGKSTQAKLLAARLKSEGFPAELISFPRYGSRFGKLVKKYLDGGFGSLENLKPEIPALLFALDRLDFSASLEKKISKGKIVICDRYAASNIAHQAAKLSGKRQSEFISWLKKVESMLPSPALTIYLDVPVNVSQRLLKKRGQKPDLHEKNLKYLWRVRKVFLKLSRQRTWKKISCVKATKLLSIEEVQSLVWKTAKKHL